MNNDPIDVSHLVKSWMHSHEEDTETTSVYRPADYQFPPSRGRKGFHLLPGGAMITQRPGPADRTETTTDTWQLDGRNLQVSSAEGDAQTMQILSVEPDRLVVKKPN